MSSINTSEDSPISAAEKRVKEKFIKPSGDKIKELMEQDTKSRNWRFKVLIAVVGAAVLAGAGSFAIYKNHQENYEQYVATYKQLFNSKQLVLANIQADRQKTQLSIAKALEITPKLLSSEFKTVADFSPYKSQHVRAVNELKTQTSEEPTNSLISIELMAEEIFSKSVDNKEAQEYYFSKGSKNFSAVSNYLTVNEKWVHQKVDAAINQGQDVLQRVNSFELNQRALAQDNLNRISQNSADQRANQSRDSLNNHFNYIKTHIQSFSYNHPESSKAGEFFSQARQGYDRSLNRINLNQQNLAYFSAFRAADAQTIKFSQIVKINEESNYRYTEPEEFSDIRRGINREVERIEQNKRAAAAAAVAAKVLLETAAQSSRDRSEPSSYSTYSGPSQSKNYNTNSSNGSKPAISVSKPSNNSNSNQSAAARNVKEGSSNKTSSSSSMTKSEPAKASNSISSQIQAKRQTASQEREKAQKSQSSSVKK